MTVFELERAVKQRGLSPVYVIVGEEDELRDQALRTIKAAAAEQGELGDFNLDVLYGDETDASEILSRATSAPVFAPRRLVLVKCADKLSAKETERLLGYLKDPCDSTTLVFVAPKLDGRTQFAQATKKTAVVVDCGPLPELQVAGWIKAEAGRIGVRLDEPAVTALKELAATTSLSLVKREIEKLAMYVGEKRAAGLADVEALRGSEAGASVFDLLAAIGARDRPRVIRILMRNLETGEAPLRILGSLVWQYRQLWKAKEAARAGREGEAARSLRLPPFKIKSFLAPFTDNHLRYAFDRFVETDSKLKGGSATAPAITLEALMLELCERSQRPQPATRPVPSPQTRGTGSVPTRTIRTVRKGP